MGNYLAMKKFYKGESVEEIKKKMKDMFSISHSFVNLNNEEDFIFVDDEEEEKVKYNSLFDYKFEEFLDEKESNITFEEIKEAFLVISDFLQECEEEFSDFVYCQIVEDNEITVSIGMIFHEI